MSNDQRESNLKLITQRESNQKLITHVYHQIKRNLGPNPLASNERDDNPGPSGERKLPKESNNPENPGPSERKLIT